MLKYISKEISIFIKKMESQNNILIDTIKTFTSKNENRLQYIIKNKKLENIILLFKNVEMRVLENKRVLFVFDNIEYIEKLDRLYTSLTNLLKFNDIPEDTSESIKQDFEISPIYYKTLDNKILLYSRYSQFSNIYDREGSLFSLEECNMYDSFNVDCLIKFESFTDSSSNVYYINSYVYQLCINKKNLKENFTPLLLNDEYNEVDF